MSYEIAKSIGIFEKQNKITMTFASNNVYPHDWYNGEIYTQYPNFMDKLLLLLVDVGGGNIHPIRSLYHFNYAFDKAKEETGIQIYSAYHNSDNCVTYYDLENGHPHWKYKGEEFGITAEQIASNEFKLVNEYKRWYQKISELEAEQKKGKEQCILFCNAFLKYFKQKVSGKYCLFKDGYAIRPISERRYQYGYSLDAIRERASLQKKGWAMDYRKACVLAKAFDAKVVPL